MQTRATTLYPFVPSGPDWGAALAFWGELGFEQVWAEGGYAGLRNGGAFFVLQDIHVPEWQGNQILVLEVEDLVTFWSELAAMDLPARYPGARVRPPTDFPWGREVHVVDPGGVCLHVRQADPRPG